MACSVKELAAEPVAEPVNGGSTLAFPHTFLAVSKISISFLVPPVINFFISFSYDSSLGNLLPLNSLGLNPLTLSSQKKIGRKRENSVLMTTAMR